MSIPDHPYRPLIEEVCRVTSPVPADVLEAVVAVESNFNPRARSRSDARGLCQIIPRWHAAGVGAMVAKQLGKTLTDELWYDPEFSLRAGALHLRWCYTSDGSRSWERAVRKYHSGSADPPPGFVDGQGTSSDQHIAKSRTAFAGVQQLRSAPSTPSPQPTEEPTMATHRFILSPGHRNTDGGGAWKGPESAWTYPICKKLKAAIERRGGKAWIISEHDNDNDPSTSKGRGLQNVAYLAAALAKQLGGVDAYLSMHYGAEPVDGFFAIFPDATGLSPSSETDVRGNNTLDIRLARTLANHVKKTGMPIRGDGTMSETRSGVGLGGYRLGELYGTRELQPTTPRLIVEGGNSLDPDEYNLLWSSAWQDRYVNALVDGLEEVFGKFKATPAPQPPQKPDIDPNEGMPRLFTIRFEVPVREAPGFVGKIVTNLPAGTTGTIIEGPKVVDGIDWYNLRIEGFGTGWVQDRILHTLEITSAVDTLTNTIQSALS